LAHIKGKYLESCLDCANFSQIRLTTPTTQQSRVKDIAQASEGFVYLVSLTGVTGPRDFVNPQVENLLAELKQVAFFCLEPS
jgi:tryptophan synthase alpha subunit